MPTRVDRFVLALWWGSLSALGGWVVPLLFRHLPTKAEAGRMAAQLFSAQTWVSLACGVLLLMWLRRDSSANHPPVGKRFSAIGLIVAAMLAALLVEFAAAPRIAAREQLALWHGVGTALFALQWGCVTALLWRSRG